MMREIRRVLVCLEFASHDEQLIRYARFLEKVLSLDRIVFLFVNRTTDLPEKVRTQISEATSLSEIKKRVEQIVDQTFESNETVNVDMEVVTGHNIHEALKIIRAQKIDLVVAAKNDQRLKSVITATKLSRKSPVSTLIIPKGNIIKFSRILVAVDGSESSRKAAEAGIYFANTAGLRQLILGRVFNVPYSYVKTGYGVQYKDFSSWVREMIESSMQSMVSAIDTGELEVSSYVREDQEVVSGVEIMLERMKGDLLVIGAKGKSFFPSYSLGSTAEEIIFSSHIPVLVVKSNNDL